MKSDATTAAAYLKTLPPDRRAALSKVRSLIRKKLPKGFVEQMEWGVISYVVPLSRYPDTYNGKPLMLAGLSAQKNYMVVYLMGVYSSPELRKWFTRAYAATGKKLDLGGACVRFKSLDALPLEVVGEAVSKLSVDGLVALFANRGAKKKPQKP
ncbi:MAG: DUF1801 domain-containing protein [Archangium sp.]